MESTEKPRRTGPLRTPSGAADPGENSVINGRLPTLDREHEDYSQTPNENGLVDLQRDAPPYLVASDTQRGRVT
jgi:hypothetical protein